MFPKYREIVACEPIVIGSPCKMGVGCAPSLLQLKLFSLLPFRAVAQNALSSWLMTNPHQDQSICKHSATGQKTDSTHHFFLDL